MSENTLEAVYARLKEHAERAATRLVKLIDTFDGMEFGGQDPITFGDMRQLINYAEAALEELKNGRA